MAAALAPLRKTKDPKTYAAALKDPRAPKWLEATETEWNGLWDKGCFESVPSAGKQTMRLMWVYKLKSDGRYKARLVVDGRQQDPSTYGSIASPTMKLTSMRILLALAAKNQWQIYADDAHMAFLNAMRPPDKPVYAQFPDGYRDGSHGKCLLLRRCLYGLHDSPQHWYDEMRKFVVDEYGLTPSKVDACYFNSKNKDLHVVVHVDDFLITGTETSVARFRKALYAKFDMDGGEAREYFGLHIDNDKNNGVVSLDCKASIEPAFSKLGLKPHAWSTPMSHVEKLPRLEGECKDKKLQKRYRSLVGCAMHPAVTCRPDVAATVRSLSAHLQHPGQKHLAAAVRCMQYLYHTREKTLVFDSRGCSSSLDASLYGTCDAAHMATHDAKGITGWAFMLLHAAISWKCRTQKLTALSSTEAELIAIDDAVRELRHLHSLLDEFGVLNTRPTLIAQDNMSTIALIKSKFWNARTKHVSLRYHHVGEQARRGVVHVAHLPTAEMTADVLTKPLPHDAHDRHAAVLLGHRRPGWPDTVAQEPAHKKRKVEDV